MKLGTVVEYLNENDIAVGLVTGVETIASGSKTRDVYRVLTDRKRVMNIPAAKIVFAGGPNLKDIDQDSAVAELKRLRDCRVALASALAFGELWELIGMEGERAWTPREIAFAYFGDAVSNDEISAVTRLLYDKNPYFRKKDDFFYALSPDESEKQKEIVEREIRRRADDDAFFNAVAKTFAAGLSGVEKDEFLQRYSDRLNFLKRALVDPDDSQASSKTKAICSRVYESTGRRFDPFRFLVKLGVLSEDENFLALKYDVKRGFSSNALAAAAELESSRALAATLVDPFPIFASIAGGGTTRLIFSEGERVDFRSIPTLTIDGENTLCCDDALSHAAFMDRDFFMIHISDSSFAVPPGSALDIEACSRGTSIYMAEGKIDMLPGSIANRVMSLTEGEERPALSLVVVKKDDGSGFLTAFVPSVVKVGFKCTYNEINEALSVLDSPSNDVTGSGIYRGRPRTIIDYFSADSLLRLRDLCAVLETARIERGALGINFPRPEVHVEFPSEAPALITLTPGGHGTSGSIVSELMIFYNSEAALLLGANGVTVPFRVSDPYPAPELIAAFRAKAADGIYDAALVWKIRKGMPFTGNSYEMTPNALIGVKGYVQASSPARRYIDIIVQRQLRSVVVRDAVRLDAESVRNIMMGCEPQLQAASEIEQESNFYWLYKYLNVNSGIEYSGSIIDETDDRFRIELEELGIHLSAFKRVWGSRTVGEKLRVRIDAADPRERKASFSIV